MIIVMPVNDIWLELGKKFHEDTYCRLRNLTSDGRLYLGTSFCLRVFLPQPRV